MDCSSCMLRLWGRMTVTFLAFFDSMAALITAWLVPTPPDVKISCPSARTPLAWKPICFISLRPVSRVPRIANFCGPLFPILANSSSGAKPPPSSSKSSAKATPGDFLPFVEKGLRSDHDQSEEVTATDLIAGRITSALLQLPAALSLPEGTLDRRTALWSPTRRANFAERQHRTPWTTRAANAPAFHFLVHEEFKLLGRSSSDPSNGAAAGGLASEEDEGASLLTKACCMLVSSSSCGSPLKRCCFPLCARTD
mmetsp:Transcript_49724/g.118525  ORF Transcript_49724/g.118525 Transcript_49724/m.118525 type:complete len:254 (+) Transcript_49724:356-1117(+)